MLSPSQRKRLEAGARLGIFHRCDHCGEALPLRTSVVREEREESPHTHYFCTQECQFAFEDDDGPDRYWE